MAAASSSLFQWLLLLFSSFCCAAAVKQTTAKPYIVYMGSSPGLNQSSHVQLLSSLIPSFEKQILNSYSHAFKGFSVMLTETQASALSGSREVVSVFADPILELHTTRSWDFLDDALESKSGSRFTSLHNRVLADVIVGVIDTGIWPESLSFDDKHVGEIPSKWKGVCMEGSNFTKTNCNRKLIGARFYKNRLVATDPYETGNASPRDLIGHGTHTASIAGGASVSNASYYGLAKGTARGGHPSARIAAYKACLLEGCSGSVILKAIDDAIEDGVDIISISIGVSSIFQSDFLNDPIAIGAFHAAQKGVAVVCSGGNDGPQASTVVNSAPWIFTVAASTIDRDFRTTIELGNNESYQGSAISFSTLTHAQKYPLVFGEDVAASFTPPSDARNCVPGSLDTRKAAGKIIVCLNDEPTISRKIKKLVVEDVKAKGVIIVDEQETSSTFDSGTFPFAEVRGKTGSILLHYINTTKNPTATILSSVEKLNLRPAPMVASFSSRGPGALTENILKPDIMAPGVAILAATTPRIEPSYKPPRGKPSLFGIKSGTSMACPHVTGTMALVKSVHPEWSFSGIKSALMTTASMKTNAENTITNSSYAHSNPHEAGAGEIQPMKALDPGLIFETTFDDHIHFLCYYGYNNETIQSLVNKTFNCPNLSTKELITNINYPTISIGRLKQHGPSRKVERVATNVGQPNSTYVSYVNAPPGLSVRVNPEKISYTENKKTVSFNVYFNGKRASKGYNYGDIQWKDGVHLVRVTFAVNVE